MRALRILLLFACLASAAPPPKTYQLPPDTYRRAVEFQRRLNTLHFLGAAWDLVILLALVATRTGPRIRDVVDRRTRSTLLRRTLGTAAMLAIPWLAGMPLFVYRHWLGMHYGLSIQPWLPWFFDLFKAGAVAGMVAIPLVVAVLIVARRSPGRWWVYGWALGVAAMIAGTYVAPLVVDPLFFRFRPLSRSNPELVRRVQQVAARAGYPVPPERIFEMDASRKTRAVNAYITGFGDSRRIVIWDTTLAALNTPQIQSVFAHELGHYALNHIPKSIALGAAGLLVLLWLLDHGLRWFMRAGAARLGIRGIDDPSVIPVALAFGLLLAFLAEPVVNTYSRWQERQADIYELEAMHGLVPDAGLNSAEVTQIMAEIDLDDPSPGSFITFWLYSHPPANERMLFAQQYDPWSHGRQPKYVRDQ